MELKSFEIKDSLVDMDERTFAGYAATWDLDSTNDIIHQGAFAKSIKEAFPSKRIKVLWQHDQPLGMPLDMYEDSKGLFVKGKVSKTRLGDEALELMRDGVVDRMSIGFMIPKGKSDYDEQGVRHIKEVKLIEFSPVTFPANENALITGVKSMTERLLIAKSQGVKITEIAQLAEMLDELKALLIDSEPSDKDTHDDEQPLIEMLNDIKSLSQFAVNRLY